jgi:hypothetical protein
MYSPLSNEQIGLILGLDVNIIQPSKEDPRPRISLVSFMYAKIGTIP